MTVLDALKDRSPHCAPFPVFTFRTIRMPGAYLEVETGRLFRIRPGALPANQSLQVRILSRETWRYAKLSDDPEIPVSEARVLAADNDLLPSF